MKAAEIVVAGLGLLAALAGLLFFRRASSDASGDSGATLLGWVFSFVAVVLLLIAAAGVGWP